MSKAGMCAQCGTNVWLTDSGGCPQGHDASQISNVYETEPAKDQFGEAADKVGEALTEAGREVATLGKRGIAWLNEKVNAPAAPSEGDQPGPRGSGAD